MVDDSWRARRRAIGIAALSWLVACFALALTTGRAGHSDGVTRETLRESFESDMRHVVYRWSSRRYENR